MDRTDDPHRWAAVEAGEGRPFRFSLSFEGPRGVLESWLGTPWSFGVGAVIVGLFAVAAATVASVLPPGRVRPSALVLGGAGAGALAVAVYLRPRRVLFERRDGTWRWQERRAARRTRWAPITEEEPLRLEREILATVEGFALYAGSRRLLSYLGDPVIGRSVASALQSAGVPVRTVMKRKEPAPYEE